MRARDLGLGPTTQGLNIDTSLPSTNHHRILFFNFVSLRQYDSQKLRFFSFLAYFYSLIQNIYISFWPYLNLTDEVVDEKFDYMRTPLPFEENITSALFFYSTDQTRQQLTLISFIILIVSFFFFFISLSCFCVYFFKHVVNFQLLFCYNFFIRFVCPIITVPISFQSGWLISHIQEMQLYEEEGIELFIVIIILDIILYLIIISATIVSNIFNGKSIIIVDYYICPSNGLFQSYISLFPSITLFLSNILPLFNSKLRYFIIALHMLFCISVVIWSFWLPYGKIVYNGFISSVSLSMLISDIHCFTEMNTKWQRYVIFLACFFVLFIVMHLFIKLRIKILLKEKKNNKDNLVQLDEYDTKSANYPKSKTFQIFGDPNLEPTGFENLSVSKALFVLRTAIITQSPIFLNGKLIDMLASRVESDDEKIRLSFLICFFPEFQPVFFALLTRLKRARFLPLMSEFQLFQLRCYDICSHPDSIVDGLGEVVHETSVLEAYLRSFWQIIDSECSTSTNEKDEDNENDENNKEKSYKLKADLFSQFDRLSRSIYNCNSKWMSIISLYPNNVEVASEYMKFLLCCQGDFVGASEWKTVSTLLNEGKTFKVNPAQISFLRAFPKYFKQVIPKSLLINEFEDIEIQSKIESIEEFVDMPEARIEFQRSTNSSYPFSIYVFMLISVISLLFILIFWIYGINSFSSFENMIERLNFLSGVSYLSQQISVNLMLGIMDYGQLPEVHIFPTPSEIFGSIFENGFNDRIGTIFSPSLIQLNGQYKGQFFDSIEISTEIISYLRNSALSQIEYGYDIQDILDILYNHSLQSQYYINRNENATSTEGLQSLLFSHLAYFFTLSFEDNYEYINDSFYYHAVHAGDIVITNLDKVSESIIKTNDKALNKNGFLYTKGIIIITAIYAVISIVFIWIDFYFLYRSFKSIMNSLCYFPKSVRQKAACPLINEEKNIDDSSIKKIQSRIKNVVVIMLFIDTLINIFLGGIILYFHFIDDEFKSNFVAITELSYYYSLETSKAVEVIYLLMAANTYKKIIPSVESKYKERLTSSIVDFIKIHQQCWNYSVEGDCGIKGEYLKAINDLKNQEKCPEWSNKTYHELIACMAEEPAVNAFIDSTKSLIGHLSDSELLHTYSFKQFIHFSLSHLYYDIQNFAHLLSMGADVKKHDFEMEIKLIGSISIIVACLLFILKIFIYLKIRGIFKLLFTFISRIPPQELVENSQLMNSLLGIKNNNKTIIDDSSISFLVQESSTPIIFLDRAMSIEFINDAFSHTFGYDANFIVGQRISTLIDDESTLFFIDSMKFFESKKSEVKTIACKKGKGNKSLFDITFIPIHSNDKNKHEKSDTNKDVKTSHVDFNENNEDDSDCDNDNNKKSFVNCIALVFVEKTGEMNLLRKCKALKYSTDQIAEFVYPHSFVLFNDNHLKMCAVCLIKISNAFANNTSSSRILIQRQNLYEMLYEKLSIFPLLIPIDSKNGFFTVVACKKNDPVELAIECLNFAFSVVNEISGNSSNLSFGVKFAGPLFAVVETGGELVVGWTGNSTKRAVLSGELIDRALKVLDNASLCGSVCVSRKTYDFLMQHDYVFAEKEIPEEICGVRAIYSIENGDESIYGSKKLSRNGITDESNNTGFSTSFIEKLKEEEIE